LVGQRYLEIKEITKQIKILTKKKFRRKKIPTFLIARNNFVVDIIRPIINPLRLPPPPSLLFLSPPPSPSFLIAPIIRALLPAVLFILPRSPIRRPPEPPSILLLGKIFLVPETPVKIFFFAVGIRAEGQNFVVEYALGVFLRFRGIEIDKASLVHN
jgi:hypothetical protein